jgi:hypothetical protein
MARVYTVVFENTSVTAIQDLFSLKAGAANGIELHAIELSAGGVSAAAEIRLRLKRLPSTVTQGSGGSVVTPNTVDSGDTKASTVTAHVNDTTQATTSGTAIIMNAWQWQVLNPFVYYPDRNQGDADTCQASEAFILDLAAAPGSSTAISGYIKYRELP